MADEFDVFPLHCRWNLLESCITLINSEWTRSFEARSHFLQKSSDNFPISLVMIRVAEPLIVVGHSRVTFVIGKPGACFVESVVVSKLERGKGLGKYLMAGTERYLKARGFSELFLTTRDVTVPFYEAVGFEICPPVTTGGMARNTELLRKMLHLEANPTIDVKNNPIASSASHNLTQTERDELRPFSTFQSIKSAANEHAQSLPPPPPPPPGPRKSLVIEHHPNITSYYMRKAI